VEEGYETHLFLFSNPHGDLCVTLQLFMPVAAAVHGGNIAMSSPFAGPLLMD